MREKLKQKLRSRKFYLVIMVIILATIGAFIPPVLSIIGIKLKILSGAEFVSIISLVVGAYFGANVFQHRGQAYSEDLYLDRNQSSVVEYDENEDIVNNEEGEI